MLKVVDLLVIVVLIRMLDDAVEEGDVEGEGGGVCVGDEGEELDTITELYDEVLPVELSHDEVVEDVEVGIRLVVMVLVTGYDVDVVPLPTPLVNDPAGVSEISEIDVVVVADGLI